jgi:hypothetical protein
MTWGRIFLAALFLVLGFMAFVRPAFRRSAPDVLGRFYESVDYTPAALTLTSLDDRAETVCGRWCPPERRRQIEQQYKFPLIRKLHLMIPPAFVHRLGAVNHGLARLETNLWASDGLLLRALPEGTDPIRSSRQEITDAMNRRTSERVAQGDRMIIVMMAATHKPADIALVEHLALFEAAKRGAACAVDHIAPLKLFRAYHSSRLPRYFACSDNPDGQIAACEVDLARECAFYPRHATARAFARFDDVGRLQFHVSCGGGHMPEHVGNPAMRLRIDERTGYWISDNPNQTGSPGGGRCTLIGAWGGWRFEALVDRDRPEDWGKIHDYILKLYDRFVSDTDGDRPGDAPGR